MREIFQEFHSSPSLPLLLCFPQEMQKIALEIVRNQWRFRPELLARRVDFSYLGRFARHFILALRGWVEKTIKRRRICELVSRPKGSDEAQRTRKDRFSQPRLDDRTVNLVATNCPYDETGTSPMSIWLTSNGTRDQCLSYHWPPPRLTTCWLKVV